MRNVTAGIAIHAVHVILQFVFALVGAVFHERNDSRQGFVARADFGAVLSVIAVTEADGLPAIRCAVLVGCGVDGTLQRKFQPVEGVSDPRRAAGDSKNRRLGDIVRQVGIAGIVGRILEAALEIGLGLFRDIDARIAAQVEIGLGVILHLVGIVPDVTAPQVRRQFVL